MMANLVKQRVFEVVERLAGPFLSPFYAGVGSILVFHRAMESRPAPRAGWTRALETSPALLETLFARLRRMGHAFVSMDELTEALTSTRTRANKVVVVTFDDG